MSQIKTQGIPKAQTGLSRRINYIRGLAVFAVAIGHFSSRFMEHSIPTHPGYLIAFFFIVSGYGIYHSLNNRLAHNGIGHGLISFFSKRALRLFPLYWLWLILNLLFDPGVTLQNLQLSQILLLQFHDPAYHWFLPAIVMCYIVAPILFWLLQLLGKHFLFFSIGSVLALNIALSFLDVPKIRCWMYLFVYCGHIFLFAFGMYYAKVLYYRQWRRSTPLFVISCFCFAALCIIARLTQAATTTVPKLQTLPPIWEIAIPIGLYAMLFLVAVLFFQHDWKLPLASIFCFMGKISLAIYIFEGMYATALSRVSFFSGISDINILPYFLLFPIFVVGCFVLERAAAPRVFSSLWHRLVHR